MARLPTIETLRKEFYDGLKTFDYDYYNELVEQRETGEHGLVKGSVLIKEIAQLSAHFMDEKALESIGMVEASYCAFMGWQLAYDMLSKNPTDLQIHSALLKGTKMIFNLYKPGGVNLSKPDIAKLIFVCALLKEELYDEFDYDMQGMKLDYEDGKDIVRVLYSMKTYAI